MKMSDLPPHILEQVKAKGDFTKPKAAQNQRNEGKNKLELSFENDYLKPLLVSGDIQGYDFEAIKLRLGPKTYYTPDFVAYPADGPITFYETKGFMRDDAAVKLKAAYERHYGFKFVLVTKEKGKFRFREVGSNGFA